MSERLEKIKHTLQEAENMVDEFGEVDYSKQDELILSIFDYGDLDWLIEQVEQVQELEKIKESHIEELGYVDERLLEAEHQNKRYREALEEISTTELPGIPIEKHINLLRKIADEALEDSQ